MWVDAKLVIEGTKLRERFRTTDGTTDRRWSHPHCRERCQMRLHGLLPHGVSTHVRFHRLRYTTTLRQL